jgi:phage terminase large subunit GpA-like protein
MTDKQQILIDSFKRTIKPEQRQNLVDWSSRSENADLTQTPWLVEPLERILGNNAQEVVVLAPTGGGKSTMLEIAVTYIVAEKPGPTLLCAQSDVDAYEWVQTGVKPALEKCDLIKDIWPSKKNQLRKDFINFPHMTLFMGGANHNNLQSKSCDYVFLDEAWCYKPGLIQEARRRTHDRFNSKVVIASQAGTNRR